MLVVTKTLLVLPTSCHHCSPPLCYWCCGRMLVPRCYYERCCAGSLSALATDRTCTPAARGGTDIPARADSSICRRHDSHMCQPLANRFSNLPDVELRPGTAACHAFGGNGDSSDGPRYHDPAFSVTHVSLADMAPNLFTAKDHDSSGSTPRCQRSTATSSAAVRCFSD